MGWPTEWWGSSVNTEKEFEDIRSAAYGMLVRSYSATNNIPNYAGMLEGRLIPHGILSFGGLTYLMGEDLYRYMKR